MTGATSMEPILPAIGKCENRKRMLGGYKNQKIRDIELHIVAALLEYLVREDFRGSPERNVYID